MNLLYQRIGGTEGLSRLLRHFYADVLDFSPLPSGDTYICSVNGSCRFTFGLHLNLASVTQSIDMTDVCKPIHRGTFRKVLGMFPIVPILALCLNLEAQGSQSSAQPLETAPATPSHPLDPLTAQEFAILKDILQKQGKFGDRTIYNWVQLQEPPKEEVLEFQPGQMFRREAQVVVISPEKKTAFEILVDLNAKKIESVKDLANLQPFLLISEFDKAKKIVDASLEARAALEKRGYHIKDKISDTFFLDTYGPGKDPLLLKKGKTIRAVRVLFADRLGGTNNYGPYVEGLMALVDLYAGKLIALEDHTGPIAHQPVPEDIFNQDVLGPKSKGTKLQIAPSTLQDIKLDGNHLQCLRIRIRTMAAASMPGQRNWWPDLSRPLGITIICISGFSARMVPSPS